MAFAEWSQFWTRTQPAEDGSSCILWVGATNPNGYGSVNTGGGRMTGAHRWSYQLTHPMSTPLATSDWILHACDNPPCVNPAHLRRGDAKENHADMDARGRRRPGALRGSAHKRAKLTEAQVQEIRLRYATGLAPAAALAREFGMSRRAVRHILSGRNWSHLPFPGGCDRVAV